ncbi:GNAT family N-acetyltransferase [Prosthecochloris sp. SCSIO W1103]|uniref:GNAT family N-acetyltransferase n=1 Tax=Prosthecochloris sp. SCSIO W1103 TaxID=2992244 RepID=UPI00223DBDCE|nr:GNAT family N-acetyltransferase [Prosthecochloris sp. SCSIO W1103]UZJ38153.1 GNAT family N-acetyltransferase [Prosthecochloris sp. SCSIO W1103]
MEIKIEEFNSTNDLSKQRNLFNECFPENLGTSVQTIDHYKWKFKSFPAKIPSYEYIARLDDEIIGYYAALPYEYIIDGRHVKAAIVCDVMTGIKARGKGVFTKLGKYSTNRFKEEGLAFSTGYPIRPEVLPGHKKSGWLFPFKIPMYGKFIKMNSFFHSKNKQYLIPYANLVLFFYEFFLDLLSFSLSKPIGVSISNYLSTDVKKIEGLEDFFLNWKKENLISLNKNIDFLNWRLGAPEKEYQIVILRVDEKVVGYSVFRKVIKEGVPCVGVLDFILLNGYEKWSSFLLLEIEKYAKKNSAELILFMIMKSLAKKYGLFMSGYLKTPFFFSFIIKQFDESIDKKILLDEQNWNLMWIDSDDL